MALKRWDLVDEQELKRMALRVLLKGLCCSILFTILFFFVSKNTFICKFLFMGFIYGTIHCTVITYNRDWLDNKIGLFDPILPGISYQGALIFLSGASICLSLGISSMAFIKGGIYSAIAFGLCVNFPTVFMLLRLNVYSNDSRLLYVGEKDGEKHYEQVFGYHPVFYYILLGIPFGRGPLGLSFRKVLESIFLHNGSIEYSILCFILCLLAGSFILSPDIANNVLPFEIRTFNGFFKFAVISLILMGICLIPLI